MAASIDQTLGERPPEREDVSDIKKLVETERAKTANIEKETTKIRGGQKFVYEGDVFIPPQMHWLMFALFLALWLSTAILYIVVVIFSEPSSFNDIFRLGGLIVLPLLALSVGYYIGLDVGLKSKAI